MPLTFPRSTCWWKNVHVVLFWHLAWLQITWFVSTHNSFWSFNDLDDVFLENILIHLLASSYCQYIVFLKWSRLSTALTIKGTLPFSSTVSANWVLCWRNHCMCVHRNILHRTSPVFVLFLFVPWYIRYNLTALINNVHRVNQINFCSCISLLWRLSSSLPNWFRQISS